jgi:hypothetical protein
VDDNGWTPLHFAAQAVSPAKNKHGVSPASLARTIANYDIAQYFADVTEDE